MPDELQSILDITGPPYWGVDSVKPASDPVGGDFKGTYYDWIVAKTKRRPAFFGRYLTPPSNKYQHIKRKERNTFFSKDCRVLLNYNQFSSGCVSGKNGTYDNGDRHAERAAQEAIGQGIEPTRTVWIYANIDSWFQPEGGWLLGWLEGMWKRGFGPGLYWCSGGELLSNVTVELIVRRKIPNPECVVSIWSAFGTSQSCRDPMRFAFNPPAPVGWSGMLDVFQYATKCYSASWPNLAFDMDLATLRGLERMWKTTYIPETI